MFYMLYCNLVRFLKSILPEEEVFWCLSVEGVCANCVAGMQHHDCVSVSPVVETQLAECALSLSGFHRAPLGQRTGRCSALRSLNQSQTPDATAQKSIIIIL